MAFHFDEKTEFWPDCDTVGPMRNTSFQLAEMPTGYVVRSLVPITLRHRLAQGGAWGLGTGCLIAALGLSLLPQDDFARALWLANIAGIAARPPGDGLCKALAGQRLSDPSGFL